MLAGLAGGLVIVAIAIVLIVALGGSSHHHRPPGPLPALSARSGDFQTIFTEGSALQATAPGQLATLHALGVNRVRVSFTWGSIAPDSTSRREPSHFNAADPADYPAANWAVYDAIVRELVVLHMSLDLVLAPSPPLWASGPGAPAPADTHPYWEPDARMFEQFVEAVGKRYSGHYTPKGQRSPLPRETFWSLWNEPNNGTDLAPQTVDHNAVESAPRQYRDLAGAAWTGLQRTGHGHDTTLIGELAPIGGTLADKPGNFAVMTPLRFVRALYCVDASFHELRGEAAKLRGCPTTAAGSARFAANNPVLFKASAFADHPYPYGLAPNVKVPDGPDDVVLVSLTDLFASLDRVQKLYGSSKRFDVYSTEFGYQTTPPGTQTGDVGPAEAARWLNWSEYLSWRMPRLLSYDQYLLADPPPIPHKAYRQFATGLDNYTGAPFPGYFAFRMPIWLPVSSVAHGRPVEVWGCVRPAKIVALSRRKPAEIQFQASHGHIWRTVATVSTRTRDGYFDVREHFPSSGSVRIRWQPPTGPAIESRTTVITIG